MNNRVRSSVNMLCNVATILLLFLSLSLSHANLSREERDNPTFFYPLHSRRRKHCTDFLFPAGFPPRNKIREIVLTASSCTTREKEESRNRNRAEHLLIAYRLAVSIDRSRSVSRANSRFPISRRRISGSTRVHKYSYDPEETKVRDEVDRSGRRAYSLGRT